jgi:ribonuclease HI
MASYITGDTPSHKHVKRTARWVKWHKAPVHALLHDFSISPDKVEKVRQGHFDSKWRPGFQVKIAPSREEAVQMDENDTAGIQVYTDGLGMSGEISVAVVLYRNGQRKSALRIKPRAEADHTVPEAEGVGLVLGLELIQAEKHVTRASIAADNLALITRTTDTRASAAHHIWDLFHSRLAMVKSRHPALHMTMRWVPGHEGVRGNEEADRLAKLAITQGSSAHQKLPAPLWRGLPQSKATMVRQAKEMIKQRAKKAWQESLRFAKMRAMDESMPSNNYLKLIASLSRRKASLLFQLHSGHIPLQAHLHKIA